MIERASRFAVGFCIVSAPLVPIGCGETKPEPAKPADSAKATLPAPAPEKK